MGHRALGVAVLIALGIGGQVLAALPVAAAASASAPAVVTSLKNDRSAPLRTMQEGQAGPNDKGAQPYRPLHPGSPHSKGAASSGRIQTAPGPAAMPATSTSWDGVNNL